MPISPPFRLGFCCNWLHTDQTLRPAALKAIERPMNARTTTLTRLRSLPFDQAAEALHAVLEHNTQMLWRQVRWVATQDPRLRLFRITSGLSPLEPSEEWDPLLAAAEHDRVLEQGLFGLRQFADQHGIRLGFHPSQYVTLSSDRPEVVTRSLASLEHQARLAAWMGYDRGRHPSGFFLNIHGHAGKDPGLKRFRSHVRKRLSSQARNLMTIENDERLCGLDDLVSSKIGDTVPIVVDFHHHWIHTQGAYLSADDPRIQRVQDSWHGIRPLTHTSTPSDLELGFRADPGLPDFEALVSSGLSANALRRHAHRHWNPALNAWLYQHAAWSDLEVEAKDKNLAALDLLLAWQDQGLIPAVS